MTRSKGLSVSAGISSDTVQFIVNSIRQMMDKIEQLNPFISY